MQDITIKIEAYGAIEKYLPIELNMQLGCQKLVSDALEQIKQQYPSAAELLDRCACAIGEHLISRQDPLNQDCTLVLLSPVAGG